ncbi:hypothetical protein GCM10023143_33490 [Compostibacter hankyongensis]|uniref:Uncharacterized protein n=1 Tax=Compostibacter hankyongensis TaxID=1007089 RepID=A0ABP8G9M0_9BACT
MIYNDSQLPAAGAGSGYSLRKYKLNPEKEKGGKGAKGSKAKRHKFVTGNDRNNT